MVIFEKTISQISELFKNSVFLQKLGFKSKKSGRIYHKSLPDFSATKSGKISVNPMPFILTLQNQENFFVNPFKGIVLTNEFCLCGPIVIKI